MDFISPAPVAFVGPFEILLLGLVLLVILFGSRAQDIAKSAGKAVANVNRSKQEFNDEIEDVREDLDEDITEIKSEVGEIKSDVKSDVSDSGRDDSPAQGRSSETASE